MGGDLAPTTTNLTEQYDGTCWAVETVSPTARYGQVAGGTTAAAFLGGGSTGPANSALTFHWTGAGAPLVQTVEID